MTRDISDEHAAYRAALEQIARVYDLRGIWP